MSAVEEKPVDLVSIIVVSDYRAGDERGWQDLRETLSALSKQDYGGPVEYLLLEASSQAADMPEDLCGLVPSLRMIFVDSSSSSIMKNEGVQQATGGIIGVLDGDCTPNSKWLSSLVSTFKKFPDTAVVSGRTIYATDSPTERIRGLLSRSYLDTGSAGATDALAVNNAGYRREVLLKHPFPVDVGAFGGKLQAQSIREDRLNCRFEPRMLVYHSYEGWGMERDIRRNTGYATVMVRKLDNRISFSWLSQLGILAIPMFFLARLCLSWWNLFRLWRFYDIPASSVPAGVILAVYLHALEIPGMKAALTGSLLQETAYR
jgi:hypothetical protein